MEKYFIRKRVQNEQKLLIIEDALKGLARAWFEARLTPFIVLTHFKNNFLKEFYSIEARAEIKNSWSMRKFRSSDGLLVEYFTEQRRVAKYFNPPMDNYEIN